MLRSQLLNIDVEDTAGPVKRQKGDCDFDGDTKVSKGNDVYQEILEQSLDNASIYSSWFRQTYEITQNDTARILTLPEDLAEARILHDEIKSLTAQLSQVKRRLGPAAERSSNACHAKSTNSHYEFLQARRACNPMEFLGEGQDGGLNSMFINRSAIKLANIDALMNFALTKCAPNKPFSFVDLCGAPGGFSEYLLYRCRRRGIPFCSGYGMSLMGSNELGKGLQWKIDEDAWMENGLYSKYTICDGADGTGDIFQWSNVMELRRLIQADSAADNEQIYAASFGVQLVVADGGVDAQREQENQEQVTQKLIVCQVAAALELLQPKGTFVLKVFGCQTPLIRSMIQDLVSRFESLRILKPISSRPASLERYAVFTGFAGRSCSWSARQWQNAILLGRQGSTLSSHFTSLIDRVDRDMLLLNLKTCFNILSHLEREALAKHCSVTYAHQCSARTIQTYRHAWDLA
jgi:cap1 methyltransferase